MTLDLSRAYDLEALDEPLAQGGYYLVLTNSNFVFGQDWICFIHAAAPETAGETAEAVPEKTPEPTAAPLAPAETDAELTARVEETLWPFFAMTGDVAQRRARSAEYYAACAELLAPLGTRVARPAPSDLVIGDAEEGVIFDPAAPADAQHLLTGENYTTLDAYGLPVGGAPGEEALVLSALVAQRAGDTDGGAPIPVVYLFTYFREDVENADHLFVHGQLVPLSEVEDRRVYEDERYVCYRNTSIRTCRPTRRRSARSGGTYAGTRPRGSACRRSMIITPAPKHSPNSSGILPHERKRCPRGSPHGHLFERKTAGGNSFRRFQTADVRASSRRSSSRVQTPA